MKDFSLCKAKTKIVIMIIKKNKGATDNNIDQCLS